MVNRPGTVGLEVPVASYAAKLGVARASIASLTAALIALALTTPSTVAAQSSLFVKPEAFADGTAKFLASRAEDEVSVFATELLFARLCKPQWKEYVVSIDRLFPTTCSLVMEQNGKVAMDKRTRLAEPLALGVLKRALELDLSQIPLRLAQKVETKPGEPKRAEVGVRRVVVALDLAQAIVRAVRDEGEAWTALTHPNSIYRRAYSDDPNGNPQNEDELWVGIRCGLEMLRGKENIATAPALVSAGIRALGGAGAATPTACAVAPFTTPAVMAAFRDAMGGLVRAVELLKKLDALAQAQPSAVTEAKILALTLHVGQELAEASCLSTPGESADTCATGPAALGDAFTVVDHIVNEDYAAATALMLSSQPLWNTLLVLVRPQDLCATDDGDGDCQDQRSAVGRIRSYLALVADVATASDADAVEASLERFSAPIGTWRRKHEVKAGVTLQGYAGVLTAYEFSVAHTEPGLALNPTLSLGLQAHLTPGQLRLIRMFLYAPIVDVGNVVSVRLASREQKNLTEVEAAPDVSWAQLFSPGLYAGMSLGRSPVDLAVGFNYVAELRERKSNGDDLSVFRVGAFLAVDVSLMPLY